MDQIVPSLTDRHILLPNNWTPRSYQMPSWLAWEAGCRREILRPYPPRHALGL
jgi:hypothetical protein